MTRDERQLTKSTRVIHSPTISADGKWIAYTTVENDDPDRFLDEEIHLLSTDGVSDRRLTRNSVRDIPIRFSADGKRLFFVSGGLELAIRTFDLESGEIERFSDFVFRSSGCAIADDEKMVYFVDDRDETFVYEVYAGDVTKKSVRRLTELGGYIAEVSLSPDGKEVVFVSEPKGGNRGRGDICIVKVDDGSVDRIDKNW
jgi:Tol biopolymer transport system component